LQTASHSKTAEFVSNYGSLDFRNETILMGAVLFEFEEIVYLLEEDP
jgi:hypothetical protein